MQSTAQFRKKPFVSVRIFCFVNQTLTLIEMWLQVAAPEIAMIKVAAPNMAQNVIDRAIQVVDL